ncbi:MAG TPA: hypothetical protein VGE24_08140, partial [Emticicia sp.]
MSITIQPQDETPHLKEEIAVRMGDPYYNPYVSKFHSDLIIPPNGIAEIAIPNTNTNSTSQESYTLTTVPSCLYSNLICKSTKPTFTLTNVKTKADLAAYCDAFQLKKNWDTFYLKGITIQPSTDGTSTAANFVGPAFSPLLASDSGPSYNEGEKYATFTADTNLYSYDESGNPNPFQAPIWGLATDFINVINSNGQNIVDFGANNIGVPLTIPCPKHVDVQRRKLTTRELEKYDGLRYPDRVLNKQYALPFEKTYGHFILPGAPIATNTPVYQKINVSTTFSVGSPLPYFIDLENDMNNALNSSLRGALFLHKKPVYTFTKKTASQNYTGVYDPITKTVTLTPLGSPSTTLYQFKIGQYVFPSHFVNAQELYDKKQLPPSMIA